jgi:squalene-hopene/tetraprenyl-beta-curcumene cyclase
MEVNLIKNLKSNDKSPSFYQIYPELFYAFFRNIDKDVVNRLSDAGYLYYQSILCLDSIIDRKEGSSLPMFITLQEEAVKILTDIFGCESIFWDFLNKRKHELFESVKLENSLSYNDKQSWAKYKEVADKKAAIAKVAIDGMYILSNKLNKNVYHLLLKSQKYFSIGFQLYDDLKDFEDDYNQKQFNWVFFILNKIVDVQQYNLQTLHKLLFVKGIAVKILDKSIHFFEKAEQIILPLNIQSKWIEAIRETKKEVQQYLDITTGYVETVSTRVELSLSKRTKDYFFDFSSVKDLQIKKSLDFIYNDYKRNYAELKHVMYLSQIEGFNNRQQIHVSDIFQRTLLNDSLITVFSKYNLDANEYLDDEIKYLLSNMNNDSIGVWKYFPTVDEIAADIDDLGIAMQFFINSSHKEIIDKICSNAIQISLENEYNIDGGIGTWIIPNTNRTPLQVTQVKYNLEKWGTGPDVEVVANYIYSLYLYNKLLYDNVITKALNYIVLHQQQEGFWYSRWYYGFFYGTYVCTRILQLYNKRTYQENIQRAISFILNNQHEDGGWGENKSDPLSTAFALLTLKTCKSCSSKQIKMGDFFLFRTQLENGGWQTINFIRPKINEPYKSNTLTTALILKALCL